ncbi:MAG TPA: hypothetical protein PLN69_12470 [bacterium]|nr:hypothetical protein [bacterium]
MSDTEKIIEGESPFEYLSRSISIVTLLYERGILSELMESGRISEEEIVARAELIKKRFPEFSRAGNAEPGETESE